MQGGNKKLTKCLSHLVTSQYSRASGVLMSNRENGPTTVFNHGIGFAPMKLIHLCLIVGITSTP